MERGEFKINKDNLTAKQKAAILLTTLPPEVANQIMEDLGTTQSEIQEELNKLKNIPEEVKESILNEFLETSNILEVGKEGTVTFTSPFTQGASQDSAFEASSINKPLGFLYKIDPAQLARVVRKEHPQTIAVILSQLDSSKASSILAELPGSLQSDVAKRLADIDKIPPDILEEIEKVLEERVLDIVEGRADFKESKERLVDILSGTDRHTEQKIISGIVKEAPKLANDIEGNLCVYEDIEKVDEASLKQVLRLADIKDIAMAIKGSSLVLSERIYNVLPPDTAKALRGDAMSLESVSHDRIIAAKQQIRNILRGLVALGKIRFVK
ncbi:MAG: FliG C-terminal domain-containing protein [Armatimonadota bacterium]